MSAPFHGLLLIDKESGGTSHDVVARARRILGTRDIGHSGTLDPMARGLMVLLVGEGTKLSNYILEGDKAYRAVAKLGVITDTLDVTGQTLETRPVDVPEQRVREAVAALAGEFEWEPPMYSAIKIDGKKLYESARKGEEVARPKKRMKFWDLKILNVTPDTVEVEMTCSKGSYVRTWIQKLGEALGTGAAMSSLVRTASFPYELPRAISLEELAKQWKPGAELPAMVAMDQALPFKKIRVNGPDQSLLMNGQISHDLRSHLIAQARPGDVTPVQVHSLGGRLIALVGLEDGRGFVIRRVFKYS